MSEEPSPIGDDVPDALLNLINGKGAVEKQQKLQEERKAREKEIRRRFRGPERNAKLKELAAEIAGRLREIVQELLDGK